MYKNKIKIVFLVSVKWDFIKMYRNNVKYMIFKKNTKKCNKNKIWQKKKVWSALTACYLNTSFCIKWFYIGHMAGLA